MSDALVTVNGHRATKASISVPNVGAWFADVDMAELVDISGRVVIQLVGLTFSGTVVPGSSGSFGAERRVRVVAGGAGWAKLLPAKGYHNDAGVKAVNVAGDAAREAGEQLGSFAPPAERVGADYARRAGPASRALYDVLDGTPWWVDYAGVTRAGPRPASPAGAYELLEFDARAKVATLALDDLSAVGIGSTLSAHLDAPETVRELEYSAQGDVLRVKAWCSENANTRSRLTQLLSSIATHANGGKLFGKYRYRVVTMASDGRVNLQAVSKAVGLPDLLPVSQKPGVSGWHAELTQGAEVYVEFIAGDPADPIVTGFPGKGEPGATPVTLAFGGGSAAVARAGDEVKVLMPPMVFTGTIGGTPASGVLSAPTGYTLGTIQTGRAGLKA